MTYTVSAFYKFASVGDVGTLARELHAFGETQKLCGTILVAPEGINATIAGPETGVKALLAHLRADPRFLDLVSKEAIADEKPFRRWKVKQKSEILTFGAPEADPSRLVGTYVKPKDWNALISRDDIVLIDTRNDYEVAIGTFQGAIDPGTRVFTAFKDYAAANLDPGKHKKVAMFCTGGIRCEKASAYLLARGFGEVYHLEGGILKYLEEVGPQESLWQGGCFVFDERVSVGHGLTPTGHRLCRCGFPVPPASSHCPGCGSV